MTKDLTVYLLHIRDALDSIAGYTRGGKAAFLAEPMIQDAVIRKLAVIGEAVKRLPPSFRDRHPDIPWKGIAGLRDVVIHEYDQMEIPRIWNVVYRDAPRLRRAITLILREADSRKTKPKAA
jgi:uncharacterized protein with HEPN domain